MTVIENQFEMTTRIMLTIIMIMIPIIENGNRKLVRNDNKNNNDNNNDNDNSQR